MKHNSARFFPLVLMHERVNTTITINVIGMHTKRIKWHT